MIRNYLDKFPSVSKDARVLEGAVVTGDVVIGPESSVWYQAVIRADVGPVRIGSRVNIQDRCVIHESNNRAGTFIEDEVTVGHGAIIHGATLKQRCLVGMGAIVLDDAVIGEEAIVGAGALVPEGMIVPPRHLALGVPARVKRPLTDEEVASLKWTADHYVQKAKDYDSEP